MQPIQIEFLTSSNSSGSYDRICIASGPYKNREVGIMYHKNGRYVVKSNLVNEMTCYFVSYDAALHQCLSLAYQYVGEQMEEQANAYQDFQEQAWKED